MRSSRRAKSLRRALGTELADVWRHAYEAGPREAYAYTRSPRGCGGCAMWRWAISPASGAGSGGPAFRQFERADNMTDRQGALTTLASGYSDEREAALDIFYNRYAGNSLVIDKWFQTQALASRDDTGRLVEELARHPDFTLANPNRARSLIGAFGANQRAFNAPDGSGYRFLAEQLIQLDKLNPQTAAKLLPPLGRWRRFDSTGRRRCAPRWSGSSRFPACRATCSNRPRRAWGDRAAITAKGTGRQSWRRSADWGVARRSA